MVKRAAWAVAAVAAVLLAAACGQKPLPVQHPEQWQSAEPDYPPLDLGRARDAGGDR